MAIHTHGKIFANITDFSAEPIHEGAEYSQGANALITAPMMCGATVGHRLAEVAKVEMSWEEVSHTQGQGNTLTVQIDGWMCNSPTAAPAQELMASTVCEHPERGLEVRAPKFPTF